MKNILVIGHNQLNIKVLVNSLNDLYDVDIEADLKDSLEVVIEKLPNLIIIDLDSEDGYLKKICKKIRRNKAIKDIPILLFTATSESLDIFDYDDSADNYISQAPLKQVSFI